MTTTELPRVPWRVPEWHGQGAACRLFPELDRREDKPNGQPAFNAWFDAKPGSPEALVARTICAICPIRRSCAEDALKRGEPWGIWGGLDRRDRKQVASEFGYPPPGDPPPHGTNSRRVKWNCDCRPCKEAHALYEAERRAKARQKARARGVWLSPLLMLVAPVRYGRVHVGVGQYLLPLALPAPRNAQPEPAPVPAELALAA